MPCSPRRRIRLVTVIGELNGLVRPGSADQNLRRLDTSNGCQDHTVLPSAERLRQEVLRTVHVRQNVCEAGCSAVRPARLDRSQPKPPCDQTSAPDAAASTASRPNVRDDGQRPSSRAGIAEVVMLIWVKREAIYFCARDWTGSISLIWFKKFAFSRIDKWRKKSRFHATFLPACQGCQSVSLQVLRRTACPKTTPQPTTSLVWPF
jgi:hypothetical protein